METLIKGHYGICYPKEKKRLYYPRSTLVRYAVNFILSVTDKDTLEDIRKMTAGFLEDKRLSLSEEKILITHIDN